MPDSGNIGWVGGAWAAGIALISAFWVKMNGMLTKESFKIYVASQEKLSEAHVKIIDANTRAMEKIFDKLDGKEDKKHR